MRKIEFIEWLQDIMAAKGLSKADLARESGISPGQITRITTGEQGLSIDSVVAIASALNLKPTEVFKIAAGLTDQSQENSMTAITIEGLMHKLSTDEQEEILDILEAKIKRKEKKKVVRKLNQQKSSRSIRPARTTL